MSHTKNIDSNHRALFVFLIDQSLSTSDNWGSSGVSISDEIARAVNEILHELVTKGNEGRFRDRYDFACIGYGSDSGSAFSGTLSHQEVASCTDIEGSFDIDSDAGNQYILASHDRSGTNMGGAFTHAKTIIENWLSEGNHMDCFPPMIFHITDGENNGQDPLPVVNEIKQLKTHDGEVLVWNIHVSAQDNDREDMFLADDSTLSDVHAKLLFALSSQIPDGAFGEYGGKYAFGYNLKAESFIKLLKIGTLR